MSNTSSLLLFWVVSAMMLFGLTSARAEAPVVERAWAVNGPLEVEAYVTINNASSTGVSLMKVSVSSGATAILHDRQHVERYQGFYIPIHSELFMQPDGVHVAVLQATVPTGTLMSMTLEFDGGFPRTIQVPLIETEDQVPEHENLH